MWNNLPFLTFLVAVSSGSGIEPPGALGPLKTNYTPNGFFVELDDLPVYVAPPGMAGSGEKAVVWGHDIYGPNSGRTYELVDQLAADTEYTVLLPDFFRGVVFPLPPSTYEWETSLRVTTHCNLEKMVFLSLCHFFFSV